MKANNTIILTALVTLSTACGGMEGDFEQVAENEDALTSINHCALNYTPNAVASSAEMAAPQGAKYTRFAHYPNSTCPQPAREMSIVQFPAYNNTCYKFQTISQGSTFLEQANSSAAACEASTIWGQLNYWNGSDYVEYDSMFHRGEWRLHPTTLLPYCHLPWGTEFRVYVGGSFSPDKFKLRALTRRADGKVADVEMVGYDIEDTTVCNVI